MNLLKKLKARFTGKEKPEHLRRGELGEHAAKKHLQREGLKFLTANFRSKRGEIDLVFRDDDCLLYVSFAINIYPVYNQSTNETEIGNQLCEIQHHRAIGR